MDKEKPGCSPQIALLIIILLCLTYWTPGRGIFRSFLMKLQWFVDTRTWSVVRSNLLISNNRVFFIQPDLTLTCIDLDTGDIVRRDTRFRPNIKEETQFTNFSHFEFTIAGKIAYSTSRLGLLVIDTENDSLELSQLGKGFSYRTPILCGKNLVYEDDPRDTVVMLNTETLKKQDICTMRFGNFGIMEDNLLVYNSLSPQSIASYDSETGKRRWKEECAPDTTWLDMVCDGSKAYVFVQSKGRRSTGSKKEGGGKPIDSMLVYNGQGELINDGKANIDDFGGVWPKSNYTSIIFRGTEYSRSWPYEDPVRRWRQESADKIETIQQRLGRKFIGPVHLFGERGAVGIEYREDYGKPSGAPPDGYRIFLVGNRS